VGSLFGISKFPFRHPKKSTADFNKDGVAVHHGEEEIHERGSGMIFESHSSLAVYNTQGETIYKSGSLLDSASLIAFPKFFWMSPIDHVPAPGMQRCSSYE